MGGLTSVVKCFGMAVAVYHFSIFQVAVPEEKLDRIQRFVQTWKTQQKFTEGYMNGDMLDARTPSSYETTQHTLGLVPMTKTGGMVSGKIECLTEADFAALLKIAQGHEELSDNIILAETQGEVRLFWHNDIGDSTCWRFVGKKREAVKNAVLTDIQSFKKMTSKGGLF